MSSFKLSLLYLARLGASRIGLLHLAQMLLSDLASEPDALLRSVGSGLKTSPKHGFSHPFTHSFIHSLPASSLFNSSYANAFHAAPHAMGACSCTTSPLISLSEFIPH